MACVNDVIAFRWDTGYVGELMDFADAVLDKKVPQATAADAVADLKLMLAIMLSAKTKKWEVVAELPAATKMETMALDCTTCM